MDCEEFQTIVAEQSRELSTAIAMESDLELTFQLQMQEAIDASLSLQPSSSSTPPRSPYPLDGVSDPSFASHFAGEIARFEQERLDHEQAEAEMKAMQEDLNRRIHDHVFAKEMSRISDEEWSKTGDHFNQPYGEGTSSPAEAFRLYCKGLFREEMVGGVKKVLAGIGIAICDLKGDLVFEMRKPLVSGVMSTDFADVKALIEGLNSAITLGIKRVNFLCDNSWIHHYVTGKLIPMQGHIATLVGQVSLLQRKFSYFGLSFVLQKHIRFAIGLANEAILSQLTGPAESSIGKNLEETCLICLEDIDVRRMFSINGCQHSYCLSCIKQHAEVKLSQGTLPKCPHEGCLTELKIESCKKLFNAELFDMLNQRLKEASIPATEKVYCPHPKCSVLMTRTEALAHTDNAGASKCAKCRGLFCMSCKVPWHNNMNCRDYKKLYPYPCAEDAKLNSLARNKLWRQCVKCKNMVELAEGCYHIYCRCGHQFCYTCGAEWKNKKATCTCRIWDERNIVYERN